MRLKDLFDKDQLFKYLPFVTEYLWRWEAARESWTMHETLIRQNVRPGKDMIETSEDWKP